MIEREPTRPRALNPRVDRDLETVCLKCLQKEPEKRYSSAEALAEDLERWQRGEPIQARPVGRSARLWRWCRRNPLVAGTSAAAVVAVALTVGVLWWSAAWRAEKDQEALLQQQAAMRERLYQSLFAQAVAERQAGNRWRSLELIAEAAPMRRGDDLRQQAIETITRTGARRLPDDTQVVRADRSPPKRGVGNGMRSPDGKLLVKSRAVRDATNNVELRKIPPGRAPIRFLSDDELLTRGADRVYRRWSVRTGQEVNATPAHLEVLTLSDDSLEAILWGKPEGRGPGEVVLWDLAANCKSAADTIMPGKFAWAVPSPDGRYLAFRRPTDFSTIHVWDWRIGREVARMGGQTIQDIALDYWPMTFSPGGDFLTEVIARRGQSMLRVWDWETATEVLTSPDPGQAYWGSDAAGRTLLIRESSSTRLTVSGRDPEGREYTVHFPRHEKGVWEIVHPAPSYCLDLAIRSLRLSEDEALLAVNDSLWEVTRREGRTVLRRSPIGTKGVVTHRIPGDDPGRLGWTVAAGSRDRAWAVQLLGKPKPGEMFKLWSLLPTEGEWPLPHPGYPDLAGRLNFKEGHFVPQAKQVALSADGKNILVGLTAWFGTERPGGGMYFGDIQFVELWDPVARKRLHLWHWYKGEIGEMGGMAISPDGRLAAVGSAKSGIEVLDLTTGTVRGKYGGHATERVTFSPDGRLILGLKVGETAALYDAATGRELRTWPADPARWGAFAISPDGRTVASGGEDGLIHLWDAADGHELARWQAHQRNVTALCYSRDGATLYSGGQDGMVRLWNLPYIRKELAALGLDW